MLPLPDNSPPQSTPGRTERAADAVGEIAAVVLAKSTAEVAGPKGPEPTRFGDWERNGRCIDF
jgi:hypothetical protein